MSEWKHIETAPKNGELLILYPSMQPDTQAAVGRWDESCKCWYMYRVGHLNSLWEPTHWMTLPTPPPESD